MSVIWAAAIHLAASLAVLACLATLIAIGSVASTVAFPLIAAVVTQLLGIQGYAAVTAAATPTPVVPLPTAARAGYFVTDTATAPTWEWLAHVDPPPALEGTAIVGPGAEPVEFARSLTFYLGPNHYAAGLYLPDGYDLETRPGTDGWTILRARDSTSGQILTLWATRDPNPDGSAADGDQVKILDP